jgi:putative transposase
MTYIRTYEGFLYLVIVIDLYSRRVVGWSINKNMDKRLVINALMMAVCQGRPTQSVLVQADHGSQYGSADYLAFLNEQNLVPSMSRCGNCHDNAVAESFFGTLKKRVLRNKIFNFIEMFYSPKKRHSHTGGVSPAKFQATYFLETETV